ncbi:MAG: methyltransferase [Variovorax sp.]|nr:methyltransferase [Variovorax sp.]
MRNPAWTIDFARTATPVPTAVPEAPEAPAAHGEFRRDLRRALAQWPRSMPPKYFYDARGSALFDRICELPEYYPTRAELAILRERAAEIAAQIGPHAEIVEFGAGSLTKVRLLLDALVAPRRYLPIDISGEHLGAAAHRLREDYPQLAVEPVVADYTRQFVLPPPEANGRRVGFFPGSTIGNFDPDEALRFLEHAAQLLRGGGLLLGADLVKNPATLHAAYNDAEGVTAAFNLNLLRRANAELDCDFDLDGFSHCAFYNAPLRRIEMHLVSRRAQRVRLDGECFSFDEGDTLHTEISHKFTVEGLRGLAARAGFRPAAVWTDDARRFSVHWLEAPT